MTEQTSENGQLSDPAEMMARLFPRRRSHLVVEIDLDPVPGWGNNPDDHRALVQRLLDEAVGHYNPIVEIATSPEVTP
ncbi:hypothetical protein [Nocardioides sp. URHA0032]|uniref:hypothetical protein n=1 Tax=Nocardioides sp. URHA0032 TaxID=1380388 RepID=UPI00048C946D|nr:hypothetical protein [Nocardioides sp. URHA0032]